VLDREIDLKEIHGYLKKKTKNGKEAGIDGYFLKELAKRENMSIILVEIIKNIQATLDYLG
jgi:hypothetical protein